MQWYNLCPKSHDLKCLDRLCPWKLHTHRCVRADTERRRETGAGQGLGRRGERYQGKGRPQFQGNGNQYHGQGRGGGASPWQGAAGGGGSGWGQGGPPPRQGGGHYGVSGVSQNQTPEQNFQGLTAQQNMLGALEYQVQQAVTRAIMQALAGAVPMLGAGQGSVPPSC